MDDFLIRTVNCPSCGAKIQIDEYTEKGDIVYCEGCEEEFLVTSLRPFTLQPLIDEDED